MTAAYVSTIDPVTAIDGNLLDGVSATTLRTLHNRGTEAKRSDGVIRDPWAVTLCDAISYDYRKFGKPNQSHGLRAAWLPIELVLSRSPARHGYWARSCCPLTNTSCH
jgi:O-methyltransferase involved in polyketide biosynthesis